MADMLTHVLIALTLAMLFSIRYRWITPRLASVAMAGAMLPDLNRLKWVVSPETAESVLGLSVSWRPMHSIGGVTIAICIGALLVRPQYRRAVAILLTVGALSHFALDLLLVPPAGSYRYLWPITSADIVLPASTVVETDGRHPLRSYSHSVPDRSHSVAGSGRSKRSPRYRPTTKRSGPVG